MCRWRRRHFEIVTVAFLCVFVYSNLPLSSALFGWLQQGKKKVTNHAAYLDRDALEVEKVGEEMAHHSSVSRGPDGCGHKLKVALAVVKAYGASFKHWHWPWRKKKKMSKNSQMNGEDGRKRRNVDEHMRMIDHCAAIAEREEYQRGHFGHQQRRRRVRGVRRPRDMDDKSALKALTRMLRRKNKALSAADHWTNIGVIRWGRRTISDIRRPAFRSAAALKKRRQNPKNGKNRRKNGRRRLKRGDDEEEEEEGEATDDERSGGRSSEEEENKTKFKYTKTAHGYSDDKNAGSNAKDKIYEAVSFEAEHPKKGLYKQRTMTEYKFHGPKHSEWRHRPPKPPKAEGRAWTGKFKSQRRRGGGNRRHWDRMSNSRRGRKSRYGRWRKKNNNWADVGGDDYYYTVAHMPALYSYGHYYDYGSPWGYAYSENYYGNGGFGYGGGGYAAAVEEGDGGFMPSGSLGKAMKMVAIVLFVLLLIIII